MNPRDELAAATASARQRSAMYGALATAFTYEGASRSPFAIPGSAWNAAFDPALGAPCSLRESAYAGAAHGALFEELMRYYEYFGLRRDAHAELPDHLAVEFEFLHYLAHLEAGAGDDAPALASLRRAQRDFLQRHVQRLIEGVSRTLATPDQGCLDLVATAAAFVELELARLALPADMVNDGQG